MHTTFAPSLRDTRSAVHVMRRTTVLVIIMHEGTMLLRHYSTETNERVYA
jgi:hypothetical protein